MEREREAVSKSSETVKETVRRPVIQKISVTAQEKLDPDP